MELSRKDQIEGFMLETFHQNEWEDTPYLRLAFLEGLKDGWDEDEESDPDARMEKVFYQLAINGLIMTTKIRIMFPGITG